MLHCHNIHCQSTKRNSHPCFSRHPDEQDSWRANLLLLWCCRYNCLIHMFAALYCVTHDSNTRANTIVTMYVEVMVSPWLAKQSLTEPTHAMWTWWLRLCTYAVLCPLSLQDCFSICVQDPNLVKTHATDRTPKTLEWAQGHGCCVLWAKSW